MRHAATRRTGPRPAGPVESEPVTRLPNRAVRGGRSRSCGTGSSSWLRTRSGCRGAQRGRSGEHVDQFAIGVGLNLAVVDDHFAPMDHIPRQFEHPLHVDFGLVDRDVGIGSGAEVPLVLETEDPGRGGAGDDGDFVERVLAGEVAQAALLADCSRDTVEHVLPEPAVHQQGDDLRIGEERAAVGMIGAHRHPPGVVAQAGTTPGRSPIAGHGRAICRGYLIGTMPQPASISVSDAEPLAMKDLMQVVAERAVAGHGGRFAEHHLADVDREVRVPVDIVGQSGTRLVKRRLVVGAAAVAVKLNVRDVAAVPFQGLHRVERGRPVAGHAEVVAVDMHRVRQGAVRRRRGRSLADDLPRGDVEVLDGSVDRLRIACRWFSRPRRRRGSPACRHSRPSRSSSQAMKALSRSGSPLPLPVHDVVIVAHQDVKALVDDGGVVELLVGVPGCERRDRGVERRGVAEAGVHVAGGKRAGTLPIVPERVNGPRLTVGEFRFSSGASCGRRSPWARRCGNAYRPRRA